MLGNFSVMKINGEVFATSPDYTGMTTRITVYGAIARKIIRCDYKPLKDAVGKIIEVEHEGHVREVPFNIAFRHAFKSLVEAFSDYELIERALFKKGSFYKTDLDKSGDIDKFEDYVRQEFPKTLFYCLTYNVKIFPHNEEELLMMKMETGIKFERDDHFNFIKEILEKIDRPRSEDD